MLVNREAAARRYGLDASRLESFELGAAATVIMCWPDPAQEVLRSDMFEKLAAALLRIAVGDGDAAQQTPRLMKPAYAFRNVDHDVKHMARLEARLEAALVFGHRVMPFLKHADNGASELLPGMDNLSIAALVRAIEEETGEPIDIANFRKRDWLQWLPVAHLAAAARILLQNHVREQVPPRPWWDMMTSLEVITAWLREAHVLEPIVLRAFPELGPRLARIELRGVDFATTN